MVVVVVAYVESVQAFVGPNVLDLVVADERVVAHPVEIRYQ